MKVAIIKLGALGDVFIGEINALFEKKYRLSTPKETLPTVIVVGDTPAHVQFRDKEGNKQLFSVIELGGMNDVFNGNYLSEEMSHFYRFHFEPDQVDERVTSEFFGFLGKRLWQKAAAEEKIGDLDLLLTNIEQEVRPKRSALNESKEIKKKIKSETNSTSLKDMADERKSILIHQRGYEFASKIDLDKIHDWPKLFSLPNAEVRKRFFTDKPDYSGL